MRVIICGLSSSRHFRLAGLTPVPRIHQDEVHREAVGRCLRQDVQCLERTGGLSRPRGTKFAFWCGKHLRQGCGFFLGGDPKYVCSFWFPFRPSRIYLQQHKHLPSWLSILGAGPGSSRLARRPYSAGQRLRRFGHFPRISSPLLFWVWGPLFSTHQANMFFFCWGPNSSLPGKTSGSEETF